MLEKELTDKTGEATLYLCSNRGTGEQCVAKIFRRGLKPKDTILDFIIDCESENIIKLLDFGEYEGKHFEVYPYYTNGDLTRYGRLDPGLIKNTVVPSVNEALHKIHENGITHRDIKPNNLFLSNDKSRVIVGDFGISSNAENNQSTNITGTANFTFGYAAPEWLTGARNIHIITMKGDYYSFGITLVYLLTGIELFSGVPITQIILLTSSGKLPLPNGYNEEIEQLICGLTCLDRNSRWGYQQVCQWCKGEKITEPAGSGILDGPGDPGPDIFPKPYHFMGNQIYQSSDLAEALACNWGEAAKQLYRGLLADFFKSFNQQLSSNAQDSTEQYRKNHDSGLFTFLYKLYPDLNLYWRGTLYKDLANLAERMRESLPKFDESYFSLLQDGLITKFLSHLDDVNRQVVDKIRSIEKLAVSDPEEAYLRFVFENLPENRAFCFHGNWYYKSDELIEFLSAHVDDIEELAGELVKNKFFLIWLEYMGFGEHIKLWLENFVE
jgi:serine/threonine protein kinase